MSHIVTWEYYNSLYNKVQEADFERMECLAEKEVMLLIGPIRWAAITESCFGYDQLMDCICKVMDQLTDTEVSGKGKGISSVSNDGYSESYVIQTEEQLRVDLRRSIRAWLSGTGLIGAY